MLKFFRKYNKIILVVGGCLLMVAFLIQGTLDQLITPPPPVVGQLDGRDVTANDTREAALRLQLIDQLPVVSQMTAMMIGRDELKWFLIQQDAQRMGLSASRAQVQGVLEVVGIGDRELGLITQRLGATPDMVRAVVHDFIVADNYRELVLGLKHIPVTEKLRYFIAAQQLFQQGNPQGFVLASLIEGSQRLSEPVIAHYLQEQGATVSGQLISISADRYAADVPEPTEAKLQELFDQYRNDLPGQSEPYGFGYRTPNRVKLEYLAVSIGAAMKAVDVEEADAIAFYDQNKERFGDDPYASVREQIIARLKRDKAEALTQRIIRTAQSMLFAQARSLPEKSGYRVIGDDFTPTALRVVADELENEFGVRPEVYNFTEEWTAVSDLSTLPLLGGAQIINRPGVTLGQYVMSALEMGESDDEQVQALRPLRLQVGMSSQPLVTPAGLGGARLLFRLTAAEPTRAPQSLAQVREQVASDARREAAYLRLLQGREQWLTKALDQGLEAAAEEAGTVVMALPPTPRRNRTAEGALQPPLIVGVGRSEALVEAMFDTAVAAATDGSIAAAPADQRTGEAAVDAELALVVYQLDDYLPMTRTQFDRAARDVWLTPMINQTLLTAEGEDAMSFDAIARRVDFVRESVGEEGEPTLQPDAAGGL